MLEQVKIAEMLCTRLCHDLTGPIGAVNNGAEFLSEEGFNLQNQAVELITSSAASAVARLQFYRAAYGRVKDNGEASLADSKRLASDFFADGKIALEWPDQYTDASSVALSIRMVRVLLNFLIIASSTLLKGGKISIRIVPEGESGKLMEVKAEGDAVKWDKETEEALSKLMDAGEVSPRNVQLYLTRQLADELGVEMSFAFAGNTLVMRAVQKMREENV